MQQLDTIGADRPGLTVPIERRDPDLATAVFDVTLRLITPTDRWTRARG
jgi:hypothetical protein